MIFSLEVIASLLLCPRVVAFLRVGQRSFNNQHSTNKAQPDYYLTLAESNDAHSADNAEPDFDVNPADWKEMITDKVLKQIDQAVLPLQTNDTNLCFEGRLVPRLYLLGAQKSGTTSLSYDLMMAGIKSAGEHSKEWGLLVDAASRSDWLDALPECPKSGSALLADYTPNNLKQASLPNSLHLYHGWPAGGDGGSGRKLQEITDWVRAPQRLQDFYHSTYKSKLLFVVILREPLSRMQSAWYGLRHPPLNKGRLSFSTDVSITLDFWKSSNNTSMLDWMWRSLYGLHIADYLFHVSPSQFVVVPMKQYTEAPHGSETVVNSILQRLDFDHGAGSGKGWISPGGPENRKNQGEHPPLEEDIDPSVRAAFDHEIIAFNNLLVSLLAKMHHDGALLIGMDKENPSEEDVRSWLYHNW